MLIVFVTDVSDVKKKEKERERMKKRAQGKGKRNFVERTKLSLVMGSRDLFKVPRSSDN